MENSWSQSRKLTEVKTFYQQEIVKVVMSPSIVADDHFLSFRSGRSRLIWGIATDDSDAGGGIPK
jgi:hypothetical protein